MSLIKKNGKRVDTKYLKMKIIINKGKNKTETIDYSK